MKPKLTYLYGAFILSLAVLVILSFLFYKRLNSYVKYSEQVETSLDIMYKLKNLELLVIEMESYSRGFILVEDTIGFEPLKIGTDTIHAVLKRLEGRMTRDDKQVTRLLLMKTTINSLVNNFSLTMERARIEDDPDRETTILRGKRLMETFKHEAKQIQDAEIKKRDELLGIKEYYESFYPGYFNTISIWAGVITLLSFFFINREVRMRSRYQTELEKKLQELNRSNYELQQFAYIASHDLQEPLRKIRTFSDKLMYKYRDELDSDSKEIINRIEAASKRMQELIQDMINFTSLITRENISTEVSLNQVINKTMTEFLDQSREKHAVITWDDLPVIKGNEEQLILLFRSLLDNAFKFAKPGESPEVTISYRLVEGSNEENYGKRGPVHRIIMQDQGIGFSNEFAEKIFLIFQRLHTHRAGYRGKGVGLAIAQRIVANHNGSILAQGRINEGATFIIYLPVE